MRLIAVLSLAFCCTFAFTAKAEEAIKAAPPIPEAKKNVDDGKATVIDVREKNEFEKGHLAGARNVPLSELKAGNVPTDLPKDKVIYTHCMKGGRAKEGAVILKEKGYNAEPMVVNYEDLTKSWETTK